MNLPFAKLDAGIVDSTLWMQPHDVLRVWIAMLAKGGASGFVRASVPAMAHLCMVPIERLEQILALLTAPDPYSRTTVEEGRRLRPVEGGWEIINHASYRNARDEESRREYQREWDRNNRPSGGARKSDTVRQSPTRSDKSDEVRHGPTQAEAEAEADVRADDDDVRAGAQDDPPEDDIAPELRPLGELPPWINRSVLAEFVRHRAVLRKPLTVSSWLQIRARLEGLRAAGHDPTESLRQTMEAGLALPVTPKKLDQPGHPPHEANRRESAADRVARINREAEERDALGFAE